MDTNKLTQYQFIGIILIVLLIGISIGHYFYPKIVLKEGAENSIEQLKQEIATLKQQQDKFSPDKNEWVRLVIKNDIEYTTDLWRTRYAVDVRIFDEDKTIGVVITAANGEEPIDNPDYFHKLFTPRIESSIEKFDWLKDYQIVLTIL